MWLRVTSSIHCWVDCLCLLCTRWFVFFCDHLQCAWWSISCCKGYIGLPSGAFYYDTSIGWSWWTVRKIDYEYQCVKVLGYSNSKKQTYIYSLGNLYFSMDCFQWSSCLLLTQPQHSCCSFVACISTEFSLEICHRHASLLLFFGTSDVTWSCLGSQVLRAFWLLLLQLQQVCCASWKGCLWYLCSEYSSQREHHPSHSSLMLWLGRSNWNKTFTTHCIQ